MEVVYCAGCGTRIAAQDIERGEVSKSREDYFCLKCSHAGGRALEPQQARPPGATTRAQAPRARSARAPREVKGPNTTLVILALGAAFLGAALYGIHAIRSHGKKGKSGRKRERPVDRREEERPSPEDVGADEPRSLFGPRIRLPAGRQTDFLAPPPLPPLPPPPGPEERKPEAILRFDFEEGLPKGWDGEIETETLPPGSTKALRARDRGDSYCFAGHTGTEEEQFRAARGTRLSFDCRSSHAVTVQFTLWCESPEEKGNFWKDLAVPAEEWKRLDVRVMDLVRDESGNTVWEGASCRQLKFKIFKSPPGLKLVIDNVEVRESVEEVAPPRGPAAFSSAGPAGEVPGDASVFAPAADTFVSGDSPGTALGARDRIEVGGGTGEGVRRTAYLRFDVKGLPGKVLSAKLRLHCVNTSRESGGELYAGGGGWDEAALTFASRPHPKGKPVAALGPVSTGEEYELDAGPLVPGEGTVELVLDSTYEDGAGYGSGESAHRPTLVVACEKASEVPAPHSPAPPDVKPLLERVVELVREGRTEEAKEEAASLGGPAGELLTSSVEEREELARLASKGLVAAGRHEQLRLRFGKMILKGYVTGADGWRLWMRSPQGAAVSADIRKLSMDHVVRHADVAGNSPEGARTLGRAWLVQGNPTRALARLSVAKVGGVEVSAEMELARLLLTSADGAPEKPEPEKEEKLPRRVTEGLVAFYPFTEAKGEVVADRSGVGTPLDLKMTGVARWLPGRNGVEISSGSIIRSPGPATKLHGAVLKTGQVTFEVWCRPANTVQTGPVRMISYSSDASHRNFTLGQSAKKIQVFLRTTTSTSQNAAPYMTTDEIVTTAEAHYVVTHAAESVKRLYKNGAEVSSMARTGGMSNWDVSYPFMIANEVTLDRAWLGQVYVVAVYNRELSAEEVAQNYKAGSLSTGWASRARRRDSAEGEWATIFNGRDLTGWRSSGRTYVEDGALVAENDGDLYHAASWTEFVLTCDFKRSGAAGLSAIGIGLASRRFGRGQWRASARIHSDGDAHVDAGGKMLWKSGAGKFPADQ